MDLTIIVPTKNRFYFIKKILNYYNNISYTGKLLILDSSDNKVFIEQQKYIKRFSNINISHCYSKFFPNFAIKENIDKINTKYVLVSGDDDYYLIKGLLTCIKYLDENNDINSARGESYLFELNRRNNYVTEIHEYNSYNYLDSSAWIRFLNFMKHPRAINTNIWRSKVFIKCMNDYLAFDEITKCPDRYFYDEILFNSILIINGKIKLIKENFFIMTLNNQRIKDRKKWNKLNKEDIKKSMEFTINKIYNKLSIIEDSKEFDKSLVKKVIEDFIYKKYIPETKKNYDKVNFNLKNLIKNLLKILRIYISIKYLFGKNNIDIKKFKKLKKDSFVVYENIKKVF